MKKILITGGTGFVGANFVYKFLELGHEIHLLVRGDSNFKRIEPIKNRVHLHPVDLIDEQATSKFVNGLRPEIILHFAAYGAYSGKEMDVKTTILTNALGTINLLNACAETGFKCFINTGSSSEYGEKNHPISEKDLLEPNNLYGVSKAAGTLYCESLSRKTGLSVATMRLFSPYGYFEGSGRLMPNIVAAGLKDEKFSAPSPSFVRDFVFIEDVIDVYLRAIDNADNIKGRIFNIASGKQHSISGAVSAVEKILGKKIRVIYGNLAAKQHEPKMWVADISLAKKILDWSPKNSLDDGLTKFINWVKKQSLK
ncbi:MAG: NAD(P)-dependent oxidoreductase [Patescibacteria group bacterium]